MRVRVCDGVRVCVCVHACVCVCAHVWRGVAGVGKQTYASIPVCALDPLLVTPSLHTPLPLQLDRDDDLLSLLDVGEEEREGAPQPPPLGLKLCQEAVWDLLDRDPVTI